MVDMIEYLGMPAKAGIVLLGLYLFLNVVGEILEVKGRVVPEFMKLRKYFARKKQERETIAEMRTTLEEVKQTLAEFNTHYNADNIQKRDKWMHDVDDKQERDHEWIEKLDEKLDKISADTLEILIEGKRETVISFASYVIDENKPVTREQFNRVFRIHREYETILEKNKLTNGEVDIAYRIIMESYEKHMRSHTFVEDSTGYDISL